MNKKGIGFFWSGIIAATIGAVGALLLAPKSGKETRSDIVKLALKISKSIKTETSHTKKRVMSIFGKANDEVTTKYREIRDAVVSKVAALKTTGEQIDKNKYSKIVTDVVAGFKSDLTAVKGSVAKLTYYLEKDWVKIKKAIG